MKPRLISKAILGIAGFLFLGSLPCSFGQTRQGTDLILLLDVSSSMSAWHEEVSGYLSGPFLKENLKLGDTFHLISIAGKPRLEISRLVEGRGDLETIIGRMFLMYPLESSADLSGALSFADSYISSLPSPRSKKVVLVTDGGENQAARISDAGRRLETGGNSFVYVQVPQALAKYGPSLTAPPPAAVASGSGASQSGRDSAGTDGSSRSQGSPASQGQSSSALQGQSPSASEGQGSPLSQGQSSSALQGQSSPLSQGQGSPASGQDSPVLQGQSSPASQGQSAASGQPAPAGEEQASVSPAAGTGFGEQFSDSGQADSERSGAASRESTGESPLSVAGGDTGSSGAQSPAPSGGESRPSGVTEGSGRAAGSGLSVPVLAGLGIGALLVLGLIIFLVARRLQDSPKRVIAQAASPSPAPATPVSAAASRPSGSDTSAMENYAASRKPRSTPYQNTYKPPARTEGPLMISLFVEDQNTMIGKRNIHIAKPGYSFTVGGGKSDFLIFLVSVPPHIAEVRVDGERCAFIPRKPQFFPDIGSQQVSDCIGKMIKIVSEKGYELHLRMERYEDPLLSLNRLLHSVDVPG
ncbi:MAG: hypothetical protein LBL64_01300 [Treponema sp.]|jgi:hypothetical protein|nr:hypothetical protein [Treponema sp.]